MSFRKEYKIPVTTFEAKLLQYRLINLGMKMLYPPRNIQSYYFDNSDFRSFFDSQEGLLPRKKIRVRFYPNTNISFNLEIKISSIEGRFKTSNKIAENDYTYFLDNGYVDNLYGSCFPKVNVVYNRSYFIFKGVRITFDKNIHFFKKKNDNFFHEYKEVIEIKMPFNYSDDLIQDIIPIPATRFSKYERAIQKIYKY